MVGVVFYYLAGGSRRDVYFDELKIWLNRHMSEIYDNPSDTLLFEGISRGDPDLLARVIAYCIERGVYHRKRLCRALLSLLNHSSKRYRETAWALIQRAPLPHLLHFSEIVNGKENTKRLRMAIAVKIANSSREEIMKAYFSSPRKFRRLFSYLRLPREKINGKRISHENYLFASDLSRLSIEEAIEKLGIGPTDLAKYAPFQVLVNTINDPKEAEEIAKSSKPEDFLRHALWYRAVLGEKFREIARRKIREMRNPFAFSHILGRLRENGVLTEDLEREILRRMREVAEEVIARIGLRDLAVIFDVSGSMEESKKIAKAFYDFFSSRAGVRYLIAFREYAFLLDSEEIREIKMGGTTSIGSSILLLAKEMKRSGNRVKLIIIISDFEENTPPYLEETIGLLEKLGRPPLVLVTVSWTGEGRVKASELNYPCAEVGVREFHPRLALGIISNVLELASAIYNDRELKEEITSRRPMLEEIGSITLPRRPRESLRKGFLAKLLGGGEER
ncbi:MAG TPA: hypothetical protein ENF65_00160, partial [Euryarchaeota archaeon]|nr:hypothetical protein [Euryarchaeota archaeon]